MSPPSDKKLRLARGTLPSTTPLAQQVGGHPGVQVTEDESLLLKPALPREIAFYQLARDTNDLRLLRPWIPTFFGLLTLERTINDKQEVATGRNAAQTLVLQNLLHGYTKPCILDVKLGTVLYDADAPPEKRARMIKKAAETTSFQTGVRLTGFQVYSNHAPDPIVYGKAYGYGLKPDQLHQGMANFFPCAISTPPSDASIGPPPDILLSLLTSLQASLADLRSALSDVEVRIVGGSALIIYEADWAAATAASGRGGAPGNYEATFSNGDDDDDSDSVSVEGGQMEVEVDERGEIVVGPTPDTDEAASDASSCADPEPRLYTLSLIDFAHSRVVPGEGPDLGVLKGVDTLIRLVDRRKQEVAALMDRDKTQ